ncbi:MAG: EamA family transporter [Terriglobia bacterium]
MSTTPLCVAATTPKPSRYRWLYYSLLTILLWGGWGAISKAVADNVNAYMNQFLFTLGLLPLVLLFFRSPRLAGGRNRKLGILFAFLTGILGGLGNIAFFNSLSLGGRVTIVVPVCGLAPLVTVLVAFMVLHERMTTYQKVGLVVALVAIYLLSL